MADKPILFSGPMVRALLAGTKTQTRRKIEPVSRDLTVLEFSPRYLVGDRLYVREHWRTRARWNDEAPRDMPSDTPIEFVATATGDNYGRFRQGMHMPRWASRLTLTVTDVRVERLQDISEADAKAEGLQIHLDGDADDNGRARLSQYCRGSDKLEWVSDPVEAYLALWDAINGAGAADANPWVAAYTFTVQMGNIDQLGAA